MRYASPEGLKIGVPLEPMVNRAHYISATQQEGKVVFIMLQSARLRDGVAEQIVEALDFTVINTHDVVQKAVDHGIVDAQVVVNTEQSEAVEQGLEAGAVLICPEIELR